MISYRNSDPRPPIMRGSPPGRMPPRADWDRPPWNRWTFQHVREIVPTIEVWRGDGETRRLERAERDLDSLAVEGLAGERTTLAHLLDATYTDGFIVLKNAAIVFERYYNGMDARTLHLSQSVAKSVTGAVFGTLAGRGLIDPAAAITDYLPELAATGWRGATVQQSLDMTTGVRFSEEYTDPHSDMGQLDVACGWKPVPPDADPSLRWPGHVWELILGLAETTRPHGRRFEYRSIETDVAAFLMERATGKRLAQLASEELWRKIGAEESACFTVDPAGYALADGGFNATLRDYARFGQTILEDGGGIVPAAWVAATRRRNDAAFPPEASEALPEGAYRNFFWIGDRDATLLLCRGVFGQLISIDFANRVVTVKLSSWPDFLNPLFDRATRRAVRDITEAIS